MEGDSGRMKRRWEENWVRGNDWSDEEYMTFVSLIAVSAQLLPSIVKTQTTSIVPGTTHTYTKLFGLTDTKAHIEEKKAMNAHWKSPCFLSIKQGLQTYSCIFTVARLLSFSSAIIHAPMPVWVLIILNTHIDIKCDSSIYILISCTSQDKFKWLRSYIDFSMAII